MKKVVYLAPIDYITGKLPNVENSLGMPTNMGKIQGRYRVKANNAGVHMQTLASIGTIRVAPSALQLQQRADLTAISKLMAVHRASIQKRQTDQAGFKAQTEFKTFNAYLYNVCKLEYEAAQEEGDA